MAFQIRVILATLIVASVNLVYGQVSTSCTTSMMSSFTPCANIITGSTNNGLVPPSTCCDLLRSLMSTNMDCACMVISANAPFFQQPLSQALALSLSQACNINGVPLQCKASGSPLLVPGPAVLGPNSPTLPSIATSPLSPQDSRMVAMGKAQKYENMQLARELSPASSPVEAETPTRTRIPQIRPVLTPRPSASHSSFASPSAFPFFIGILVFGIY
ncbi:hypothetical protein AAZX31_19G144400 [Glycine max]|uniref:Bifunctional inhibitor/plant lipid transfer protein/seed storage helical domain-containing protein n=2 Tax=Glycine subgen. Soja TaxID=1462606 RepID=K7MYL7_SOYBN|nr:non-specific lipid transfer protein GPI-anchored 16 [Glycine max]XP_028217589.1 uncharacterized protein LOC114399583 [Glycine soja]KAG5086361.1 hypothetical protein JHK82_053758 [Glycine max]KAH1078025.1 hypothetical protein GYH30_053201 [Glycine max]KAH1194922.1 hypothetical protein GmHk_19G055582 [Glycine max]KHN02563.1 hypothetical protein glysoja_002587 [Glycine soja]KRG95558.1 hypothetical protein GLYMA_19G158500v4 [Glycine max]|eukprot:XP_006604446.2 uncharacterized protein LOC100786841 [Glycine max]